VRVEAPINLNATYNNGTAGVGATLTNAGTQAALVVDGVAVSVADRVLVYQQTTQTQNGIYVVTNVGSGSTNWILTRSSDADTYVINSAAGLSEGSTVFVQQGATGAGETYTCNTTGVITFGTTNITFAQISSAQIYSAGTGLTLSGTQFSITNTGTAGTYGDAATVPVITTNAQGQVTSVTPTAITITGAAVSGNIAGQAGSVANALTAGTFLTSGGTFDGSAARTFAVDATDANTASKVVARDASGNFSAGTITATLSGSATSATTATNLAGGAANRIAYQTSAGISNFITAPTASNQVLNWNGSAFTWSAGTISGVALGSNLNTLTFGTYLTGTSYNGSGAVTLATNATNANTASTLVARDASGNFSAGTITASLSGNATTATTASNVNNGTLTMNVSGTGLSGSQTFTANQSGNATFTVTSNATSTAGAANTIVARDGNGYIFNNYFNSTDNSVASGVTAVMVKAGDSYLRSGTAASIATFISGQTMNIAGSATTLASGQSNWSGTGVINNVVGLMAWKNYGNSHVIFDASQSTSPSGGAVNNTNAANAWSASYPTLMGWNGSSTYGVRVDSARVSDTATNQSGGTVSATTGAFSSTVTFPGGSNVASNGDFIVRRSSGATGVLYFVSAGGIYLYYDGSNFQLQGGSLVCSGNVTAYSDERVKTNWRGYGPDFVERLAKIKHGTFDRTDTELTQDGVSAQSLQELLPHSVLENTEGKLSVSYGNAALVAAVKLAERVVALEARIAALEAKG
jgi:hypothetical protein